MNNSTSMQQTIFFNSFVLPQQMPLNQPVFSLLNGQTFMIQPFSLFLPVTVLSQAPVPKQIHQNNTFNDSNWKQQDNTNLQSVVIEQIKHIFNSDISLRLFKSKYISRGLDFNKFVKKINCNLYNDAKTKAEYVDHLSLKTRILAIFKKVKDNYKPSTQNNNIKISG
jgi:hypothetical protein